MHERLQSLFRSGLGAKAEVRREFLSGAPQGLFEHFGVESFFVAKMMMDRGDVGACALANLPDGGGAKADAGEDLGGSGDQLFTGFLWRSAGLDFLHVETHMSCQYLKR